MLSRIVSRTSLIRSFGSVRSCSSETIKPSFDCMKETQPNVDQKSFATLLRNSTFVQMGNPAGKVRIVIQLSENFQHYWKLTSNTNYDGVDFGFLWMKLFSILSQCWFQELIVPLFIY